MARVREASLSAREWRVLERLLSGLTDELGEELLGVWLYGSRARGESPRPESDIDVLVITRHGRDRDFDRVSKRGFEAAMAEDFDPFLLSTRVVDQAWIEGRRKIESFFIREIDRDKIVLTGSSA